MYKQMRGIISSSVCRCHSLSPLSVICLDDEKPIARVESIFLGRISSGERPFYEGAVSNLGP